MIKRVPLKSRTTRKCAEVGCGKPPKSTQFSTSNQTDHARPGAEALDFAQLKFAAETDFVILPGENPLDFQIMHARLVEELSPNGPLEEDAVLTIAKCLWHKQRYQRFLAARVTTAQFDRRHEPYDEATVLNAFSFAIRHAAGEDAADSGGIRRCLDQLGGPFADFADHLEATCPRREFRTAEDWFKAMQKEFQKRLPPAAARFADPPTILTDDVFARELEFEEWIDKIIAQALTRLEKIKKSKQQTSFREAQRLGRARQGLVVGLVK
jgi:hypothetical protein